MNEKEKNIVDEKLKFFKSPIIVRYLNSLLGVGYDSNKEKSLSVVLIISSLFLSIASGSTTFLGFREYIHWSFSLLMTLGLQGLLFVVSWRIGSAWIANKLKWQLILIYLIAFSTSVFFSYSSLLNTVYSPKQRNIDEIQDSKILAFNLVLKLKEVIKAKTNYENSVTFSRNQLLKWYENATDNYQKEYKEIRNTLDKTKSTSDRLKNKLEVQIKKKRLNPSVRNTNDYLNTLENSNNSTGKIKPLGEKLKIIDTLKIKFEKDFSNLTSTDFNINIQNLNIVRYTYAELISNLSYSKQVDINDSLKNTISQLSKVQDFIKYSNDSLKINQIENLDTLKKSLYSFIAKVPQINESEVNEITASIGTIGKYGGDKVHFFVVSLKQLWSWNFLAIGSFIIAFFIDILVLLCGLLGAKPESFLNIKNADDLDDLIELSLETIISANVKRTNLPADPYAKRILLLLRACEPDLDLAKFGTPATISIAKIKELNMATELGIFLSSGLAQKLKGQDKIALTSRLILWFADQIVRFDSKQNTTNDTFKSF